MPVSALVIEDAEHVVLGECAHLSGFACDPVDKLCDVADDVSLRHLVFENCRAEVEHVVHRPG
jgi:hypothetical protein